MLFTDYLRMSQRPHMTLIGQFGKYHNTLCLSPHILHKHCFQFLLGLKMAPRENKNNAYAKLGGQTKSIMVFSELAYIYYIMTAIQWRFDFKQNFKKHYQ